MLDAFLKPKNSSAIIPALGLVAQSVEQRIENPCVGGSIPPRATKILNSPLVGLFLFQSVQSLDAIGLGYSHQESSFKRKIFPPCFNND